MHDLIGDFYNSHYSLGATSSSTSVAWISFDRPLWLLAVVPLWVLIWFIARRSLAGWDLSRQMMQLVIRCLVVLLLCLALAEPRTRWQAEDVSVVAVLDVSDSVPHIQQRLAGDFLAGSLSKRLPNDRFGLVTVAREALVQSLPSSTAPHANVVVNNQGDLSNLRHGIDMAKALVPSDSAGRIVLLSDGNDTSGYLASSAASLLNAGIPLDVASVEYDRNAMVRVDHVAVPAWARDEETITVRVVITAGRPATGKLSILINGSTIDLDSSSPTDSQRVELAQGLQVLSVQLRLPQGPVHRIEAVFEPDDPAVSMPQLLRAEGITFTSSRSRVLVLAEDAEAVAPVLAALGSEERSVEVRTASLAPESIAQWSGFDAVVLFNQPAFHFTQAQQEALASYVHDVGGGLLVIGGPESYGSGGWIGSPLEETLPVLLDPPHKRQMPMGALGLIIDRSGSMSSSVAGTGMDQQQIANEAAILGTKALSRLDQLTVIAFDDQPDVVVPLTFVTDPEAIARRVRSIGPRGGTNLFPAIDAAASELANSPGGVKHIIVLTDGQTIGDPNVGLAMAADLKRRGITLSTVSIGDQSNDPLLVGLAQSAGGKHYNVSSKNSKAQLPQIFIKEAQTVRRSLIWEGPAFSPKLAHPGEAMRGVSGTLPGITGYIVTAERGGLAATALRGPQGDPILAQWQHGLGRVTAFTSDASSRWNGAWISWPGLHSFWGQQIKWVMRPSGETHARVTVDSKGERAKVWLDLVDHAGERVNFAAIRARLVPPINSSTNEQQARDVSFRQIGPGRYEADVDTSEIGTHLLSVRYDAPSSSAPDGGVQSGTARAAITRRAAEEFRQTSPQTEALWDLARQTNGRIYKLDSQGADLWVREHLQMPVISRDVWQLVAVFAIAVFLADVASRRISLDMMKLHAKVISLFGRAPDLSSASMATLAAAKARASDSILTRAAGVSRSATIVNPPSSTPANEVPASPEVSSRHARPSQSQLPPNTAIPGSEDDVMTRLRAAKRRSRPPM